MDAHHFGHRTVAGEIDDEARAWLRATRRGFLQDRGSDENLERWWRTAVEDGQRWRQVTRTPRGGQLAWESQPVATFASLDRTITVGPPREDDSPRQSVADFITDVTVRATDRRQGLLRRLMTDELLDARRRGVALAALTSSEGGIYGRFGFGVSQRVQAVEVDCGPRFALRRAPQCVVEEVDPAGSADLLMQLMDRFQARHRGAHQRMAFHRDWLAGTWDWEKGAASTSIRVAVALDGQGPAGAVVLDKCEGDAQLEVVQMIADGDAELALWQFVATIDLVQKVAFRSLQEGSPLRAALVDSRVVRTTEDSDWTWLRILDVPAALAARGWDGDGTAILAVHDTMGLADGCWRVVAHRGTAEVSPVDPEAAEVSLDAATLAEAYLGGTPLSVLAAAGRVDGEPEAVRRLGRMLAVDEPPRNLVAF